jgi:uncharacterized protein
MNQPSPNPPSFPETGAATFLAGPAGRIEIVCELPEADCARSGIAVICHPHPLHGGSMHNKVVTMCERALRESGLRTVRFNFRGIGASEGEHDEGKGELDDLLVVAQWAQQVSPGYVLWLAGFSFGSFVAARGARHLPVKQLISIAPPVSKYAFDALPQADCPWLVIQGDDDDVVEANAVAEWVAGMPDKPTLVRMPGAGHFFHRKLMDLRGAIKNAVKGNLPPRLA